MTRNQLVIDDARRAVLEFAHAFVDQRNKIDQAIGYRRVDGIADRLRVDAFQSKPIGILVLGIDSLRHRDHFRENVEFFGHAGPAAEQHIDDLLEIEQPERQLQIARIENQRAFAEAAAIFVMHVEQENPQVRPCLEDFVQQQRYAGRFADAGRAEHGEMLREHLFDIDIGEDGRVLLQGADIDLVRSARGIDRSQLLAGNQFDIVADGRIIGDAALEFGAIRYAENLAEQIDRGAGDVDVGGRQILAGYFGDHGDDGGIRAADADKPANGCPHRREAHLARSQKSHAGKGSTHRNHTSERCHSA
jgi:hypothetical protein